MNWRTTLLSVVVISLFACVSGPPKGEPMTGEAKRGAATGGDDWIVHTVPGMADVSIYSLLYQEYEYSESTVIPMAMDIYYPANHDFSTASPAVIHFCDNGDIMNEMWMVAWAELLAASGIPAITYESKFNAKMDFYALVDYVYNNADTLGIDPTGIGLWAGSRLVAKVVRAVNELNNEYAGFPNAAALLYGTSDTLDEAWGETDVLFVIAGRDVSASPSVQLSTHDAAKESGIQSEVLLFEDGVHAFDWYDSGQASRDSVKAVVDFFLERL